MKRRPASLHQKHWNELTPRQKMLREKSLIVLAETRNSKNKTLSQAAKENNISSQTVVKHTNGFKKINGRLVVKKWDRISRPMRINADGKETSIEIRDSRTASVVGRYHNAVKQFLNTGDKTKLQKFRSKKVKDVNGKIYKLETDPAKIISIHEKIEEPEFYELYQR